MASGSQKISRDWLQGEENCARCGMKFTNIAKQVGTVRTIFPSRRREVICFSCQQELTDARISRPEAH